MAQPAETDRESVPRYFIPQAPADARSSVPRVLYRRFTERAHAENFVSNGEILFRSLAHYRTQEADEHRRDAQEGSVSVHFERATIQIARHGTNDYSAPLTLNSPLRRSLAEPERFFLSCYSYRRNSHQRKFGRWLVRIHRARPWLRAIQMGMPHPSCLFWGRVAYQNEGAPTAIEMDRLWLAKPFHLKAEWEFRIMFKVYGHEPGRAAKATARIVMPDMADYADILED